MLPRSKCFTLYFNKVLSTGDPREVILDLQIICLSFFERTFPIHSALDLL